MPEVGPHGALASGIVTLPPCESAANARSASALSFATIEMWKLLPGLSGGPKPSTESLPMRWTASVIGNWMCMILFFAASGALGTNDVSPNACFIAMRVPNTVS